MKLLIIINFLLFINLNSFAGQVTNFKVNGHQFNLSTDEIVYFGKITEEQFLSVIGKYFPEDKKFKMRQEIYQKIEVLLKEQRDLLNEFLKLTNNFQGMVKEKQAAPFHNAHAALRSIDSFEKFKSLMGYKGNKISHKNYLKYRNASVALEALSLWKINFKKK